MTNTTNTQSTKKTYKAFNGKVLYDYKQDRDGCIKFYNKLRWASAEERISFIDWNDMVEKINSIDVDTQKEMRKVYAEYMDAKARLDQKLYAQIDKLIGFDKVMEKMM